MNLPRTDLPRTRRILATLGVGLTLAVLPALPASAHPLGNFTVNTADAITVTRTGVDVLHVIDLAEIPTVQLRAQADTNGDGTLSAAELSAYAPTACRQALASVSLLVDGSAAVLGLGAATGQARAGQAGLSTTRFECSLHSATRPEQSLALDDAAAVDRVGWKEVTATVTCGQLVRSDVPGSSPSSLLTAYPADELTSPLNVHRARLTVSRSGPCTDQTTGAAPGQAPQILPRGADRLTSAFTRFVGQDHLSLPIALLALLLSVGFGCAHALAPGHGKSVIAAYLVGQRGTRRQAFWLGTTVTVAHTASVLVLGAALSLGTLAAPERVIPATEVLSGILLAGLGGWLLLGAVRRFRSGHGQHEHPEHPHDHHDHHDHDHPHPHDHGLVPVQGRPQETAAAPHPAYVLTPADHPQSLLDPPPGAVAVAVVLPVSVPAPAPATHSHGGRAHSHAPLDDRPLGWRSLAAMGVAGGLVPSPSALVVLLGATALGRAAFGVLLVVGYGVGMAITLTAAGLLLLRAQALATRRGWNGPRTQRLTRLLPVLTAVVVVLVGAVLVGRGIATGLLF